MLSAPAFEHTTLVIECASTNSAIPSKYHGVLSQLAWIAIIKICHKKNVAGNGGFEPPTISLTASRSTAELNPQIRALLLPNQLTQSQMPTKY